MKSYDFDIFWTNLWSNYFLSHRNLIHSTSGQFTQIWRNYVWASQTYFFGGSPWLLPFLHACFWFASERVVLERYRVGTGQYLRLRHRRNNLWGERRDAGSRGHSTTVRAAADGTDDSCWRRRCSGQGNQTPSPSRCTTECPPSRSWRRGNAGLFPVWWSSTWSWSSALCQT